MIFTFGRGRYLLNGKRSQGGHPCNAIIIQIESNNKQVPCWARFGKLMEPLFFPLGQPPSHFRRLRSATFPVRQHAITAYLTKRTDESSAKLWFADTVQRIKTNRRNENDEEVINAFGTSVNKRFASLFRDTILQIKQSPTLASSTGRELFNRLDNFNPNSKVSLSLTCG